MSIYNQLKQYFTATVAAKIEALLWDTHFVAMNYYSNAKIDYIAAIGNNKWRIDVSSDEDSEGFCGFAFFCQIIGNEVVC